MTGLWRHPDFVRLWSAATISTFGSLVTRTALPFAAILVLDATPFAIGLLAVAELVPGFLIGLVAGAWVDRLRRRPILIATDLGRAALLATIPAAAVFDALTLPHLYAVAAATSALSVFFDVAYQSYLPSLVRREELVEGNSKLTAAGAVAEFAAFGSGGWLVQWLTAPVAILLDAGSFVWSAVLVARIRSPEPPPVAATERPGLTREIGEGLRVVLASPTLRALAGANFGLNLGFRVFGTVFLLYVNQKLGFDPGILGLIFAVGGVGSLLGAVLTNRVTRLAGLGPTMAAALALTAAGQGLIPLAVDASLVALALLVAQQLVTDPAATVYDVTQVSLRQAITPDRLQGRVNASMRVVEVGAMLAGALVGGVLGEVIGLRPALVVGVAVTLLSALCLALSPVRRLVEAPPTSAPTPALDPAVRGGSPVP